MQTSIVESEADECFLQEITACMGDVKDGVCEGHAREIFRVALR